MRRSNFVVVFLMQAVLIGCGFLALLRTEMSSCERTPPPSPTIKVTTAVGKQEQSATRSDGWTVVVALNTVGSSEPPR